MDWPFGLPMVQGNNLPLSPRSYILPSVTMLYVLSLTPLKGAIKIEFLGLYRPPTAINARNPFFPMCTNGGPLKDVRLCVFLSPHLGFAVGEHLQNRSEISDSFIGEESRCLDWMGLGHPHALLLPERAKKERQVWEKKSFWELKKRKHLLVFCRSTLPAGR